MTCFELTKDDIASRLTEGINEETTCVRSIVPYMKHILGWSACDIQAEYKVHSSGDDAVDYAVPSDNPRLIIEAKSLGTNLEDSEGQLSRYLDLSGVSFGLLTDGMNFRLMERREDSENVVVETFSLRDEHPNVIESTPVDSSSGEEVEDVLECAEDSLPSDMSVTTGESILLQYYTGMFEELNPIHTYLCVDCNLVSGLRKYIRQTYDSITYIRSQNKKDTNVLEDCADSNLIVYDNAESDYEINSSIISESVSSFDMDDAGVMTSSIPILVIDTPENDVWNEGGSEQLNLRPSLMSSFDLVLSYISNFSSQYSEVANYNGRHRRFNTEVSSEDTGFVSDISDDSKDYIQNFWTDIQEKEYNNSFVRSVVGDTESVVKLSEAVASVSSESQVTVECTEISVDIIMKSLRDVGFGEDESRFDVNMRGSSQSSSQKKRRNTLVEVIKELENEGENGVSKDVIIETMVEKHGFEKDEVEYDIAKISRENEEIYEQDPDEFAVL